MKLAFYLSRLVTMHVLAATLVLTLLGLSLDLLKSATDLLGEGGGRALVLYAMLRAPLIAATLFPIAVLTGAVLAFLALVRRSEMIVIRGVGKGIFGTLGLLMPCAILLGLGYHVMGDRVAPWAEARLSNIFPASTDAAEIGADIWSRGQGEIVHGRLAAADGTALEQLTIWKLDRLGLVTTRSAAASATYREGAWTLHDYRADTSLKGLPAVPEVAWPTRLTPTSVRSLASAALAVSTATAKEALSGEAIPTRGGAYYRTLIAHSYVEPFIPAIMLLLAAAVSFNAPRGRGNVLRASLTIMAGFVYAVLDGVLGTLSEVGAINVIMAATVPSIVFAALGIWSLMMLEDS
ncbi:MAG: LptF/LptG family permease [Alphaproteobacteria bacterium]|jgi:lipopolysaccharide export system permease protein